MHLERQKIQGCVRDLDCNDSKSIIKKSKMKMKINQKIRATLSKKRPNTEKLLYVGIFNKKCYEPLNDFTF